MGKDLNINKFCKNERRCWCGGVPQSSIHNAYLRCENCGTFVARQQFSQNELKEFYTFDKYWHSYVNNFGYPSIEERAVIDFRDRIPIWFRILKKFKPDAKSVFEIGCAHGGFLHFCQKNGIKNVVGVEVDEATCEFAKKRFNLQHIIQGLFPNIELHSEKFDVVCGFDVLEHFTDPIEALKAVKKILNDDGICIFQTPAYRGEDHRWMQFKPAEHLFLFDEKNIHLLFDRAGLEAFAILPGIIKEDMFVLGRHKVSVDKIQIKTVEPSINNLSKTQKIAIGLIEHMGDIVACEPVSRYLRSKYPYAHIVWCVRSEYRELIDINPHIDETLIVDCLTEWITLKQSGIFDEVVDLHIHNRVCPVCNLPLTNKSGNIVVTGENYYNFGSLLSAFSRGAGLPAIDGKPKVYIPESVIKRIDRLNLPSNYVVFHCLSNEKERDWLEENWFNLARYIAKNFNIPIVEVGTKSVLEKSDVKFFNLCGKTSILETAEILRRALLFVGVDSGPAHLANAVETFGIILLGHYRNLKRYLPFTGGYADGSTAELIYNDTGSASKIPLEQVIEAVDTNLKIILTQKKENSSAKTVNYPTSEKKARLVAFFLPQFHPIPENDEWWGKGFTDWRNVVTAKPLFPGHYQPRIPADLGFYDLRLAEVRKSQAKLAKEFGIEAFCFWHYWFNGKLLLERPLVEILKSGEPDFPFCLAWANENWTRRWDGFDQDILQEQTYGGIKDHIAHFEWLVRFFKDPRYFKIDGKPVFLIYRPAQIPDLKEMISLWKKLAKESNLPGLFLIAIKCSADAITDWKQKGFDGELIFQPLFAEILYRIRSARKMPIDKMNLIFDYDEIVEVMADLNGQFVSRSETSFATVTPSWDNTPRRKNTKPFILTNSSPETFERWLKHEIERIQSRKPEYRIVFINAWNEWAEENYLEPDLKFGLAYLEAVKRAVYGSNELTIRTKGRNFFSIDEPTISLESLLQFAKTLYAEKNRVLAERYFKLALRYAVKTMAQSYHNLNLFNKLGKTTEAEEEAKRLTLIKPLITQIQNEIATMKYDKGLTSIIILTFNQLEYTKRCVESIRRCASELHEIIFVDNGSKDGTREWLRKLVSENTNYKLIENKENLGFAKGCNQGIQSAMGEYIVLLNNDVIVTEGWLSGLLDCLKRAPDAGIVGPMTNNISGLQKIDVNYKDEKGIEDFAKRFRETYRGRRIPLRRIVGFCMLFKKELTDKIGLLDESFGTGNFEDDDLCLRAELAGFRNYIAGDVFIHHYGSRSFIGNNIDYSTLMSGNRKRFNEKWNSLGADLESETGKSLLCLSIFDRAEELYQKGNFSLAVKELITGLKIQPENKRLLYSLAEKLIELKQYELCLNVLKKSATTIDDLRLYLLIGYCEEGLGNIDEADKIASEVLSLDGNNPLALNLKGIVHYKQGEKDKAIQYFKQAIEADPGYGEPYTNLGFIAWEDMKTDEAIEYLERGFKLSPNVSDISSLYYSAISSEGLYERAEKVFEEVVRLYPLYRQNILFYIDILTRTGKLKKAMDFIEKFIVRFGVDDDNFINLALSVRETLGYRKTTEKSKRPTLSLAMIVKNEEDYLAQCLESVKNLVDEIVIVDTGSQDRTRGIAKVFGARVYDFPWNGDFSEARNFSLSKVEGDWILVLDADEVIAEKDHRIIRELIQRGKRKAYTMITRNYTNKKLDNANLIDWEHNSGEYFEERGSGWFPTVKVRLFPNDKMLRFENPVHEVIDYAIKKEGYEIVMCPVPVHHYGRLNEKRTKERFQLYCELRNKLDGSDNKLEALNELALIASLIGRFDEVARLMEEVMGLKTGV